MILFFVTVAIAKRLMKLFPCYRVGSGETGWSFGTILQDPFHFQMIGFARFKNEVEKYKKLRDLLITEAQRLLP